MKKNRTLKELYNFLYDRDTVNIDMKVSDYDKQANEAYESNEITKKEYDLFMSRKPIFN